MITIEEIMNTDKDDLQELSHKIEKEDLPALVEYLSEKDDKKRYPVFLLLQYCSKNSKDVYQYWNILKDKLISENSYQRSIGLMLIAENSRCDTENQMGELFDDYCRCLSDEKPITIRQCIQSLAKIEEYQPELSSRIADKLMAVKLDKIKETMQKVILIDILNVLVNIRKKQNNNDIDQYIMNVLTGSILDKKAKKQLEDSFDIN